MSEKRESRPIGRRSFLKRSAVLVTGLSITSLIEACAGNTPAPAGPTSSSSSSLPATQVPPTVAASSRKDLRVGIVGFPVAWDSAFATGFALGLTKAVLDPLVFIAEDLSATPGLAKSWKTPDGGKTWEFDLVETTWHDGKPFTSQDVKTHYERLLNPATGSPGASVFDFVQAIEAPDPRLVRFKLKGIDMDFPILTGQYQGSIQAAHVDPTTFGKKDMVGTGPFKWDKVVPGESIRLVKNPNYFMKGSPAVESLTFVVFEDERARVNALVSGAIDVAPGLPPDIVQEIKGRNELGISQSIPGSMLTVAMRTDQAPGKDRRVIQALRLAIDREALAQAAFRGFATTTGDTPVAPGSPFYVDIPYPKRDVAAAKALLKEAGYPDGLEVELWVGVGNPGHVDLAVGIQSMARDAGFKVKLVMLPRDIMYSQYWPNLNFGVTTWSVRPTADAQLRVTYTCTAKWNESKWCDSKFDAMLDEARGATDPGKRKELYTNLQKYLAENGNTIIPFHFPIFAGYSKSVQNLREHPMAYYTDYRKVSLGAGA